jgi:hypothetical protein
MGQTLSEPVVDKVFARRSLPRPRTVKSQSALAAHEPAAHALSYAQLMDELSPANDLSLSQKSESGDGDSLIFGTSSMQGWRISMEDAHTCILDMQAASEGGKGTDADKRLAFFGVYDGHGGDKVAIYTGEHLHEIVTKQEAWKSGDLKKALQDGFLATDRAILSGMLSCSTLLTAGLTHAQIPSTRRKSLVAPPPWPSSQKTRSTAYVSQQKTPMLTNDTRPTLVTREPFWGSRAGPSRCRSTTSRRTKVGDPRFILDHG